MVVARLPLVIFAVSGKLLTASVYILFVLIDPSAVYWAFGSPSTILFVLGADFVYAPGTIFIAKIALHHEQSITEALFQTMTQGYIGTASGLIVSTIVFNTVFHKKSTELGVTVNSSGTNVLQSAELEGYRSQWTFTAFALRGELVLLAALFLHGVRIVRHKNIYQVCRL
ncbi:putative efflux transporter [Suillus paluster]|uniref:putative efflux transporter n=1 Tax=Suillus paluster TaxID=48578 RepID=UPI001B862718|nr:putative efflux transporter [Suillus paluster]KAG1735285.1 putative efflux transporter [Suillus paluster]